MADSSRPLAIVTGASSGIGYHLAWLSAEHGYDLLIAADQPQIVQAADDFRRFGGRVDAVQADLATTSGVDRLCDAVQGRAVEALLANAGHGLGKGFLDQDFGAARHVVDTNITGTLYLIHRVVPGMRARGQGRVLITGSIAGFIPGSFQAVYNASKAFLDSFALALRNELKDSGVSVTCLMPGVTDTQFFARADLLDTKIGTGKKADAGDVAKIGFEAMLRGEGEVVAGLGNKLQVAAAHVAPAELLAEQHRKQAAPGTASP